MSGRNIISKKLLSILLLFSGLFISCTIYSADYFVSPDGNLNNSGTEESSPWPLQYAADNVGPGDTIHLMSGIFSSTRGSNVLKITQGGSPDAYVTYKPADGHDPVIYASGQGVWGAVLIDAPYIRFENIDVMGDNQNLSLADARAAYEDARAGGQDWENYGRFNTVGIVVGGRNGNRPHHVEIINNTIRDFPGGGIQVTSADYVMIENNTIYNNAIYGMYAESGISIFHSFNYDDNTSSYRMIVRGNTVYSNYTQIPWLGIGRLSDGNGIIIDDNRNTQASNTNGFIPYTGRFLVENNVIYDNGGGGVNVYLSDKVDVVNNTTYGNGKVVGYPEIRFNDSEDGRSFNNITYARDGVLAYSELNSNDITSEYNIYHGGPSDNIGPNDSTENPLFTDIKTADFTLQVVSPGINSGGGQLTAARDILGIQRPQEGKHDRGAYERRSQVASSVTMEAEDALLSGDARIYLDDKASGGSALGYIGPGSSVLWSNVPQSTSVTVSFASQQSGDISLYISGEDAGTFSIESNGTWSGSYIESSLDIDIPANADFEFRYNNGDSTLNIDRVVFWKK